MSERTGALPLLYLTAGQVENDTFTDALWDLLQSVGIVTDLNVKNDILRKIIV